MFLIVIKIHHFFLLIGSVSFPYISAHYTVMRGEVVTRILFWSFFSCGYDFTIATGDGLVSVFSDKYNVHKLFIVSRLSTNIQLSIQGLLIIMGRPIRNTCLGTVKHDWICIAWQWTNSKNFLFGTRQYSKFQASVL